MSKEFRVSVQKLTTEGLMREACECTFLGTSHQSLKSIYKSEHSPARTQLFWVKLENIPLFVSTHFLRHHVGLVPYQLTCRDDRNGGNPGFVEKLDEATRKMQAVHNHFSKGGMYTGYDFDNFNQATSILDWLKENADRQTPVNLGLLVNAQSLIDMAKVRLCRQAHKETIKIFSAIKKEIAKLDSDLAEVMVPKCVYRGGLCGEPRCCGYNATESFAEELNNYCRHFTYKQRGAILQTNDSSRMAQ